MATTLRLCREYGQGLDWWDAQPRGSQALYMADLRKRDREQTAAFQRAQRGRRGR